MKILIDMQALQSGSSKGGIGRYAYSLLEAMVKNNTKHEIAILLNSNLSDEHYPKLEKLIAKENIYTFYTQGDTREFFEENYTKGEAAKLTKEYAVSLINPDIFFIMSLFEGLYESVTTSVGEIFPAKRTVVILYDLIPLAESKKYLTDPTVNKHYLSKVFYLIQSGKLLSISQFSKEEATDLLKIPQEQIVNISSAIDPKFTKIDISKEQKEKLFAKYNIKNKFLMFTGSFDIRKNQENLIKSFASIPKNIRAQYQLLIIGTGSPSVLQRLTEIVKEEGFKKDEVIFLGFVTDEELLYLYNLASLFVFPTLREGFGLPALEAMSCGVPTIGSNTTSIPEVINRADALFSPKDINSISSKMLQVLEDKNFANQLREHGLKQAKNFSWDISAQKTLQAIETQYEEQTLEHITPKIAYQRLLHKISKIPQIRAASKNTLTEISNDIAKNKKAHKKNIGIITTYNTKCGIASYSKYLSNSFKNELIILAPYVDAKALISQDANNVVRSWTLENTDFTNLLNEIIYRELEIIFIQFNYGFFNFYKFNEFIEELVKLNIKINITFHSTTDDSTKQDKKLLFLKESLDEMSNIFVHTAQDIKNLNNIGIEKNITLFNQGVIESSKIKTKTPGKTFKIATYGFFLKSKGLLNIIEAFALLHEKENISLLMLNAKYSDEASDALIKQANELIIQNNLQNHITINTDYLSDEETIEYLSKANLIVYPYTKTGESSSAAVRMAIAAQTNIAVTPHAIFDEVKDFSFVFDSDAVPDLTKGLKKFIEDIKKENPIVKEMKAKREHFRSSNSYTTLSKKIKGFLI